MRQPSFRRLLFLFVVASMLFGLMRHAQWMADARAAEGEAQFRARAAAYLDDLYAKHGWQRTCSHGHWLSTRGRRLVTDQGRRWHGVGADYEAGLPVPRDATFVRISAESYFEEGPATEPARLSALVHLIDNVTNEGVRYVLVRVPADSAWLWRAQMATLVAALADRPEVMFDVSMAEHEVEATKPALPAQTARFEVDALRLGARARIQWIREAEAAARAPAHVIAIDAGTVASDDVCHHGKELDYARVHMAEFPVNNIVVLGRRPSYALRSANAWFVEPLRARAPSVQPATL